MDKLKARPSKNVTYQSSTSSSIESLLRRYKSNNPFVNYLVEYLHSSGNRKTIQQEKFKAAGARWNQMTDNEKAIYITAANYNKRKIAMAKNPVKKKKELNKLCTNCGRKHSTSSAELMCIGYRKADWKAGKPVNMSISDNTFDTQSSCSLFESIASSLSSF